MEKSKGKKRIKNNTDALTVAFDLTQHFRGDSLENWLNVSGELKSSERALLEDIHQKSLNKIRGWNEEELKMKMLSFLFYLAQIDEDGKIATFYERSLFAEWDNFELSVICDCMIATPFGLTTPKAPYFFLQEFKKQKGDQQDPEGQMLAAMLIAQKKNKNNKPIYGAWLTGSIWFFTILEGKNYYSSSSFDATKIEHLNQIVFILRNLKQLILG